MSEPKTLAVHQAVGKAFELVAHGFEIVALHFVQDAATPAGKDTAARLATVARTLRDMAAALGAAVPTPPEAKP